MKIGLDKFCDLLSKINMDFTDYILEDWEAEETGNIKLDGLTEEEWMDLYIKFLEKRKLLNDSILLEKSGVFAIVLECIKTSTAQQMTEKLKIPTIGIGSSVNCDGQVLVFDDIVGINNNENLPKFVKKFMDLEQQMKKAVEKFSMEVKLRKFPGKKFTYQ